MNIDEKTRYDRQVRLWGKSTQQKLRATNVLINGVASAAGEVAKNLALAGVRSIVLNDAGALEPADFYNNFLVQGSSVGDARGKVSSQKLKQLNPFVSVNLVDGDGGVSLDEGPSLRVTVSRIQSTSDALREVGSPRNAAADILLLVADLGRTTLGLFLYRKSGASLSEQLNALLFANTAARPAAFQRALLLMRMRECQEEEHFFKRLVFANTIVTQLGLALLTREDVEFAAGATAAKLCSDAIDATVAGGVFAQLIIHAVGAAGEGEYAWAVSDCSGAATVQVGGAIP
ncbi:putative ThiF family [Trypanosoma vivax]|uniref:Putative ubiquitin activating enzyme n=1 Tax=Trypanosoma vivax (strain Y486) TaxID=1055687 RepID=G0UBX7_TRYVY|nr:putative ubiquitin activating enzyme [Trypanosoma vivax]KAH8609429.1 putative ThiF family [Trypanosoma vivax]CCC53325.1 putative ubiquitin activating enzyme [Trypanosoma vivax Y486]